MNGEHKVGSGQRCFRPRDAATYLGVSESQLWALASTGQIETIKLSPRVTIVTRETLDGFLEARMREARAVGKSAARRAIA